jgi:hypothetical protein
VVKILKFFDADPGSGMVKIRIRDEKIRIRDPGETSRIRNTEKKSGKWIQKESKQKNSVSASIYEYG